LYQQCAEFGFFQTSDDPDQPFGPYFPLDYFIGQCLDVFGPQFNRTFIEQAIKSTNEYFRFDGTLSNVLFPYGAKDPWRVLGVRKAISPTARPLRIAEASSCADMDPDSTNDSELLLEARDKIARAIEHFLRE